MAMVNTRDDLLQAILDPAPPLPWLTRHLRPSSEAWRSPSGAEFDIPEPPQAVVLAFQRHTGHCLGIVIGYRDGQDRHVPARCKSVIAAYEVHNGRYYRRVPAKDATTRWHMV